MRLLFLILIALVALIQYPLWLGKGGWFKVWELQTQLAEQNVTNEGLRARNSALDAEVQDLRTGTAALEDRARGELGMMREGEVFVQILPKDTAPPPDAPTTVDSAATGATKIVARPAPLRPAASEPRARSARPASPERRSHP